MSKLNWGKSLYAVVPLCTATAIALPAQIFTVLHSFVRIPGQGGHDSEIIPGGIPK